MEMYILKRKSDGKFFDGRYMKEMWGDKPRLFRSISGMKNAVDDSYQALNPEWYAEYIKENPVPFTEIDSNGRIVWTSERMKWSIDIYKAWAEFRRKSKGMSYLSDNYEVIVKEI